MIRDAGGLLLVNGLFLASGLGVTGAAGWWRGRDWRWALGLAYLAGVAAYGVTAQLLYVLGAPMVRWQVVAVCAVLASGVIVGLRRPAGRIPRPRVPLGLALAVAGMLALLAVDLWFQPLWTYDAWTFWTPKARALVELDGLDARWFTSSDLLNKDYPLLLPAVEAAGFRFTGYQQSLLDLQSWLLLVGFVAAVLEIAAARARALVLWAVLAMIVFAPSVANQLAAAEADIPVAIFFACSGLCALLWLEEGSRPALALATVFAAGTVATKVEGLIFAVALYATLTAVVALRSRRDALTTLLCGATALGVGIVPWRIWLLDQHVSNQAAAGRLSSATLAHGARIPHAAGDLVVKLLDPTAWILLVPFAVLATVLACKSGRRRSASFALGTVGLSLLGLVFAYWSTPLDFQYHLATSARRVVTGPVLFWSVLAPLLARSRSPASGVQPEA